MNIIPFESKGGLPAYLKAFNVSLYEDLAAHASQAFPVMSIKGKTFAVVRDGERVVLPNPLDPDSPATSIEVVIIKANKHVSKVFYLKGYDKDTSDKQRPDCYSNDGIRPPDDVPAKQSETCATCPHNQFNTGRNSQGELTKGKACNDTVRLAIAPAGQVNDPMLLRVPPASIRGLGEYGQQLAKRGAQYTAVVTKIAFDKDAESPKLTFKPVGFLDEATFRQVQEMREEDIVQSILGLKPSAPDATPQVPAATENGHAKQQAVTARDKTVAVDEVLAAVGADEVVVEDEKEEPKSKPVAAKPTAKTVAKPAKQATAPTPAPVAEGGGDDDLDLDGINFDD